MLSRPRLSASPADAQSDTLTAFWLNLDAELELQQRNGYRQSPRVAERIRVLVPRLSSLLGPHGRVIGLDADIPPEAPTLAWCPTPSALTGIAGNGLRLPAHPPFEVLRRVNHRRFCAELGQPLPGARHVWDFDTLREVVAGATPTGDWVLKRPFGFAGRERRRAIGGTLDPSTAGFARACFARGESLQVEPWVERLDDVAVHGWVFADGRAAFAEPVLQQCDAQGRFQRRAGLADERLGDTWLRALQDEARAVAVALHGAGYFGPFGLDGYSYRDGNGHPRLNPRSEINARFTMGYRWPPGLAPHLVC